MLLRRTGQEAPKQSKLNFDSAIVTTKSTNLSLLNYNIQYMLFVASRSSIKNDTLCCQIVYLRHVSAGDSANQLNPDLLPITFIENSFHYDDGCRVKGPAFTASSVADSRNILITSSIKMQYLTLQNVTSNFSIFKDWKNAIRSDKITT